jgi:hypothetical protein
MGGMIESKVPGIKATHAIITPRCRTVERPHLDADPAMAAFEEAVGRLRAEYRAICAARGDGFNAHVVLTIQRPEDAA